MQVNEACGSCEYYPLCRGGCRREREPLENGRLQKNRLCEDHRIFFCSYGNRLLPNGKGCGETKRYDYVRILRLLRQEVIHAVQAL